ncbi:bile acid:sodium symporter family protein [Methylomarinum vadi]|uniref:bile acid:sodium symporter family protein n=1 Tax=Methylomarinum vadi TaxID=438855 RepID=UPI00126906CC|nr:hypothetical protein [Methylomarinum vadi]
MNAKSLIIFMVILIGLIFNQGHEFSYLIKYLLMAMLFFPFLTISPPKDGKVYWHVLAQFAAMALLSLTVYWMLVNWDHQLSTIAFLLAFTPTATAAPVVIRLLRKNVEYVVLAVVVTNLFVALLLPFVLSIINPGEVNIVFAGMLFSTFMVVFLPLVLAQLVKFYFRELANKLVLMNQLPFLIWMAVLYLATSKASAYLFGHATSFRLFGEIALVSLVMCGFNFLLGRYLGGKRYAVEASQALGQKNTLFMAWVALEYVSHYAALGPVCYLVFQNIYNSILLNQRNNHVN